MNSQKVIVGSMASSLLGSTELRKYSSNAQMISHISDSHWYATNQPVAISFCSCKWALQNAHFMC